MGKFVLELHAPEAYDRVIFSRSEKGLPLPEEERAYFGFDHAEIGSAFARSWRFPDVFVKVIKGHHDLLTGQAQPNTDGQVLALIQLADYLANTIEPAASDLGFDPLLVDSHRLHAHANLSVADVEKHLGGIKDSIRMSTAFLNFG